MEKNVCRFIEHFCGKPFDIIDCCNIIDHEEDYKTEYAIIWEQIFNEKYDTNTMVDYIESIIDELRFEKAPIYNGDFVEDCIIYELH